MTARPACDTFRRAVHRELNEHLIPFWMTRPVDQSQGGFIGWMSHDGAVDARAPKGLILNARLLWTYAALYRYNRDPACLELARRAYAYLDAYFLDRTRGGYFWLLDAAGQCIDDLKKIYGQAFIIYALAEFYQASADPAVLARAAALFDLIEAHARDRAHGGYIEICRRDWTRAEAERLGDGDMAAPKSMNNHLHLLEAYTGLYRVRPDTRLQQSLYALMDVFIRHIYHPGRCHLNHFFDMDWRRLSEDYTFGHDIEATWLLWEAAETLDDPEMCTRIRPLVLDMARVTREQGLDAQGGLAYTGRAGQVIDAYRDWWCQAEAVVGFLNACGLTGDRHYLETAEGVWRAIERFTVDRKNGEWFWRVDKNGRPDYNQPKISPWKGPYHNVRACLETLRRLHRCAAYNTNDEKNVDEKHAV